MSTGKIRPVPSTGKVSRFALPRRTFLRGTLGVGTAVVGLPMLEAMLNSNGTALAGGADLPMQFITWFMGNGYRLEHLEPTTTGEGFTRPPELEALVEENPEIAPYISIVTGMQNWCYAQVTHHEGMTAFNGYHPAQLQGLFSKAGGPTLDQLIADHIEATAATPPPVRSIQCGVSKRTSIMDSGTTMHVLSHRGTNEPLYPVFNPQQVFQTLFGEFIPKPDDSSLRLSVLSAVREDIKKLQGRLGAGDKQRLEAHLQGVAELEQKLQTMPPTCMIPGQPTETNQDVNGEEPITSVNKVMSDLIVHAFKCDITRVASLFFIGGAAETVYDEISQNVGHHYNTHDGSAQQNQVHPGVMYAHNRMSYLLSEMQKVEDPTGKTLLDTGLVMSSSDCSIGLTHSVSRQPFILVGKLRDRMKAGYHHQVAGPFNGNDSNPNAGGNTSDVLFTILKAFNKDAASIGDMTPRQMQGWWYGSGGAPNNAASGSSTVITEITGAEFGK
jgi:hypothetical protein